MEKEFVSYEIAIALKELKYDGDYNYTYTIDKHLWYGNARADGIRSLAAPLKQQVFRWFREKYNLSCYIAEHLHFVEDYTKWKCVIHYIYYPELIFDTYEEAENACIDKLIELAKYLY